MGTNVIRIALHLDISDKDANEVCQKLKYVFTEIKNRH